MPVARFMQGIVDDISLVVTARNVADCSKWQEMSIAV